MSNVYHLRPDNLPTDVQKCLAILHAQARRGVVSGLAFVAFVEGYGYIANAAGKACDDLTNTRGMLLALDDKLAKQLGGGTL